MPCFVRRWSARTGMESHLRQALARAHQDLFTRDDQGLESALYREHVEGREFLGLAIYDEEAAVTGATRRALLEAFALLEAAYAERPGSSLRLTTVFEFVSIGRPVVSGMAAVLRSAPASWVELSQRLKTIARQIVEALAPSRLLVGHADDDPGLLVFICDDKEEIDLPRYMGSSTRSAHLRAIAPFLIEPPRWFALDPTWRYFRGRQQR